VSKLTKPPTTPSKEVPPVVSLDTKITQVFSSAARGLHRFRAPIIIAVSAIVAVVSLYFLFGWMQSSREEGLAMRLFQLVDSREAKKDEKAVLTADLDRLIQDSRGAKIERYVLKSVTRSLLGKAYKSDADLDSTDLDILNEHSGESKVQEDNTEIVKKIEEYAQLGRERFPDDQDMQAWSSSLLERVKSEREFKSKALEQRAFRPMISTKPAAAPGTSTQAAVPPEAVPPSGAPPAAAPPEAAPPTGASPAIVPPAAGPPAAVPPRAAAPPSPGTAPPASPGTDVDGKTKTPESKATGSQSGGEPATSK